MIATTETTSAATATTIAIVRRAPSRVSAIQAAARNTANRRICPSTGQGSDTMLTSVTTITAATRRIAPIAAARRSPVGSVVDTLTPRG